MSSLNYHSAPGSIDLEPPTSLTTSNTRSNSASSWKGRSPGGVRLRKRSPQVGSPAREEVKHGSGHRLRGVVKSLSSHTLGSFSRKSLGRKKCPSTAELDQLAFKLEKEGKLDEAGIMYSRHCIKAQKELGNDHPDVACDMDHLGHLLLKEGKLEEALPLYFRALEIQQKAHGEESAEVATCHINLARCLDNAGKFESALEHFTRGHDVRASVLGADDDDTLTALAWMGDVHMKLGSYEAALPIFRKVVRTKERTLGEDNISLASALNNLAALLVTMGKNDEALPLFTRSHEIYSQHLGPDHPHAQGTKSWMQHLTTPPPEPEAATDIKARQAQEAAELAACEADERRLTAPASLQTVMQSKRRST
ncbi:unnamed protein product [Chrysoparadoxa australica]